MSTPTTTSSASTGRSAFPAKQPTFAGVDVAKLDADGKLHRIVGFTGDGASPDRRYVRSRAYRADVPTVPIAPTSVGAMLRDWRDDRRRSQLDLALSVGVSTRHLSFVETGKSKPSPELVLAIAEHLDVPLRERNTMLLAAGYAPRYQHTPLDDEAMASVRFALGELIEAHDPYPALVVDRQWNLVMANAGAMGLVAGVADHLLEPPINVYRVTLHPDGMAPAHRQPRRVGPPPAGDARTARSPSPASAELRGLLDEVSAYPTIADPRPARGGPDRAVPTVVVPLRLRVEDGAGEHGRAVVVLDEHVDRHAGRHHPRRAPRRAVPSGRRSDGADGRRPSPLTPSGAYARLVATRRRRAPAGAQPRTLLRGVRPRSRASSASARSSTSPSPATSRSWGSASPRRSGPRSSAASRRSSCCRRQATCASTGCCARLAALDPAEARELVVDAWRMCVPKKLSRAYDEAHPDGPG